MRTNHDRGKFGRFQSPGIRAILFLPMRRILFCAAFLTGIAVLAQKPDIFPALRSTIALGRQSEGFYLLPTNQLIQPAGQQSMFRGRPVDIVFDSQKRLLAVLNWRSILLLDSAGNTIAEIPSRSTSYTG